MNSRRIIATVLTIAAGILPGRAPAADPSAVDQQKGEAFFERSIRPLLIKRCGECHGQDEPEGELTLTTPVGIVSGGANGEAVIAGKPGRSRLIQAVRYTSKLKMPPDSRLPLGEVRLLEKWVLAGAVLPGATAPVKPQRESDSPVFTEEDRKWWSFQPIRNAEPPNVGGEDRVRTPVDRFVLRKLEEHGLSLSSDADRRTLIRRVTFDLIGLPPTPAESDAFVNDGRPDAHERLVERLLNSPQYGERWGRHWLDVARYADTNGGGFDYVYPNAWRYRDYVVRALNEDKPFDQFLIEQLAGDLLPVGDDDESYVEQLKATGFLTLAPKGLGMQDKELMALDVVDDQIDVLGRSIMGMTLACARCHDHKFDPLPTEDYYALAGIFRSTVSLSDTGKNPSYWPERPLEPPSVTKARAAWTSRKSANDKAIAELKKAADAELVADARKRLAEYVFAAIRIYRSANLNPAVIHWTFDAEEGDAVSATTGPAGKLGNLSAKETKPLRGDGKIGKALSFAGQKDVVTIEAAGPVEVDFGKSTDFSVSLWIKAADGYSPATADSILSVTYPGSRMWFIALRPGSYNGIYLRHYDGSRAVDIKPATNQLPALTDRNWHHVVFLSDRDAKGSVWIDGKKTGEVSIAMVSGAADFRQSSQFVIGSSANAFRGSLDDLAIWNRLLTPSEIRALASAGNQEGERLNVAAVERRRQEEAGKLNSDNKPFSYPQAAEQGLVTSVLRNLVTQLAEAEANAESPYREIIDGKPESIDATTKLITDSGNALKKLLDDRKNSPLKLGSDSELFYSKASRTKLKELRAAAKQIAAERILDAVPAMLAFDSSKPVDLKVHIAGDRKNLGRLVPRGFPQILSEPLTDESKAVSETNSGRLELARWLTSGDHPLTARVLVNRVWQWHFGEGLVSTPDNFGRLGERPSHPDLLDWLASRLIADGWSIKQLHRQILLSSTYRQSSSTSQADSRTADSVDSGNRLLWRMNRRRLEAEPFRDAMLAVSGQLDERIGGTVNSWKPRMFSVNDANEETANYKTNRRSIYLPVVRGAAVHEMLQLFDFGDPNSITPRRDVTTVTPQALFLMNNPFVLEQSNHFADRLREAQSLSTDDRIRLGFRLALGRQPSDSELARVTALLSESPDDRTVWSLFAQSLFGRYEFSTIE